MYDVLPAFFPSRFPQPLGDLHGPDRLRVAGELIDLAKFLRGERRAEVRIFFFQEPDDFRAPFFFHTTVGNSSAHRMNETRRAFSLDDLFQAAHLADAETQERGGLRAVQLFSEQPGDDIESVDFTF